MKVMMIGHSNSGKTSYMAAMYAEMQEGIGGFSIAATREEDHSRLKVLGNNLKRGVYPTSTDILQEYSFKLLFEGAEIMAFDWYDYRGGALSEHSQSSSMVADLHGKIRGADALIVFLDGDSMEAESSRSLSQCRLLASLIHQPLGERNSATDVFPISFVVTKGDRPQLHKIWSERTSELKSHGATCRSRALWIGSLLSSPGLMPIKSLLEMFARNESVSALLTATGVSAQSYNVHFPFLFSMAYSLKKAARLAQEQWIDAENMTDHYERRANIFDDFGSWWTGSMSHRETASLYRYSANLKWQQMRSLESPLEAITELLEDENGVCCHLS